MAVPMLEDGRARFGTMLFAVLGRMQRAIKSASNVSPCTMQQESNSGKVRSGGQGLGHMVAGASQVTA